MEYQRSTDGQIQAVMAQRAGKILLQYERLCAELPVKEQFESTLSMALLQMMLTSSQELLRQAPRRRRNESSPDRLVSIAKRELMDEPELMGLDEACVVECWKSTRKLTYREVFECIRNALSHPCPQGNTQFPATGFSTVESGSLVERFVFTQSSWVNSKKSGLIDRFAPVETELKPKHDLEAAMNHWASNYAVEGLSVELKGGKWRVVQKGALFIPVVRLSLMFNSCANLR